MAAAKHSLDGKVALITGASSGYGAETAVLFARLGSQVALTDRDEANLRRTAAECEQQPGAKQPFFVVGDLTNEEDVRRIVDSVVNHFGRLDILVNNAGTFGSFEFTSMTDYDSVMNINVRAVFHLTSEAIPHLIKSKGASIVNVSSISSERAGGKMRGLAIYCMSKAAIDQFTRSLALELAEHKIRVNSVNPSTSCTGIQRRAGMDEDQCAQYLKRQAEVNPFGRLCEKADVARAIAFLASEDASFITGVHLKIDGGFLLQCVS